MKGLSREVLASKAKVVKTYLERIPKKSFTELLILFIILTIAVITRLLPLRWGMYIAEFDSYQVYRQALYIYEKGFASWLSWHDTQVWFPWGRAASSTNYVGVAFAGVILYSFLSSLGFNVTFYAFCTIFPIILAVATCIVIYLFTKEVWGGSASLFAALFLALSSSYISRTELGYFKDETVGIFCMLLAFTFFLKALSTKRSYKATFIYSTLAALSIALLAASWGAFMYVVALLALFAFVLILMKKSSLKLLITYAVSFGLAYLFMGQIPKLGYAFFNEWTTIAVEAVFVLLLLVEGAKKITSLKGRVATSGIIIAVLVMALGLMWWKGMIVSSTGRFLSIINPTIRSTMPLIESVAEQRPGTWASFFLEFGIFIFFGIFGLYFTTRKLRENDIFLILFGVTSVFFAASFIRLTLIMAPAFAILSAIALIELAKPAMDILKETVIFPRKKVHLPARVGKEFGVAILLVLLIVTMPTFYRAIQSAYAPITMATSSIPVAPSGTDAYKYQDWVQALSWMKENLPENAIVCSWWDYGYWITTMGNKTTLADNGTINSTQIAVISCIFLTTENRSVPILRRYNVSDVAVFVTWTKDQQGNVKFYGYGEDNKWYWMAQIGNGTIVNGEQYNFYQRTINQKSQQTTLYLRTIRKDGLIESNETIADSQGINATNTMLGELIESGINPTGNSPEYFTNVFASQNRFVFLWNVQYLTETKIDLKLEKPSMVYGNEARISGSLTDIQGKGLEGKNVTVEYSSNLGGTWDTLGQTTTTLNGQFLVSSGFTVGGYLIRASFGGELPIYHKSTSQSLSLNVTAATSKLDINVPIKFSVGKPANLTARLAANVNDGNVTIQYSYDRTAWEHIAVGRPLNGTYSINWTPTKTGTLYLRATWNGDYNYDSSISDVKMVTVE